MEVEDHRLLSQPQKPLHSVHCLVSIQQVQIISKDGKIE